MESFLPPSVMIDSSAGDIKLGWQLWSFRFSNTLPQALGAFKVLIEKPAVVPMALSFLVAWSFSLEAFSGLPLFCTFCFESVI